LIINFYLEATIFECCFSFNLIYRHSKVCKEMEPELEEEEEEEEELMVKDEASSPERLHVDADSDEEEHMDDSTDEADDCRNQNDDPVNLSVQRRNTPTPPLRHIHRRRHSTTEVASSRSSNSPPSVNGDIEHRRSVRIPNKCQFFYRIVQNSSSYGINKILQD
jgi:hypothetical protein